MNRENNYIMPSDNTKKVEQIWSNLPTSNIYEQLKIIDWNEELGNVLPNDNVYRTGYIQSALHYNLSKYLESNNVTLDTFLLSAFHILLQLYLNSFESIIGCHAIKVSDKHPEITLRSSYVYIEETDQFNTLLEEVGLQLDSNKSAHVKSIESYRKIKYTPAFFYESFETAHNLNCTVNHLNTTSTPDRPIKITTLEENKKVIIRYSFNSSISSAIDIDFYQRTYEELLAFLLSFEHSEITIKQIKDKFNSHEFRDIKKIEEAKNRIILIWAKVLNVDKSFINDDSDYFVLGGTSLNAFQTINQVRNEFGLDISVKEIIENPTVHNISSVLASRL